MNEKKETIAILEKIINDFSTDNLVRLFRNKTTKFRMLESPAPENPLFTDGLLLGEFECGNSDICIYTFKTHQPLTERSGKKAQYDLAKKILKENIRYAGGFFIFYDEQGNFRFSLVYDIPLSSGRREWSNFKRYTYYVSKEQTNKTFIQQMSEADFSSLDSIIEAFSVEKVTREFYNEIANWYFWALEKVKFPDDAEQQPNGRNIALIRFITRIIFVWFMKEKKLINPKLFDYEQIKNILKNTDDEESTYYKAILQNLFFATLNTPIPERKFRKEGEFQGKNGDYMNHGYFRYHNLFCHPEEDIDILFNEIPFLNGGLFECLDKRKDDPSNDTGKEIRMDGFSDKEKNQPIFPNELFFSKEKNVDLTKYYGNAKYKKTPVQGLIPILNTYNFTVDENTPIDEEVALDPELLGKVFENLLASYNPETATTARKATGSYYTPREIVDYMVTESLKHYFKTNIENTFLTENLDEKLNSLFSYGEEDNPFDERETDYLIGIVNQMKIIDPAVGSGAFPIGVLNKLVFLLSKLDPHNKKWKQHQIRALDYITDPTLKNELCEKIENSFKRNELDYGRKLYLIQNCIYGVDIQPIAIHIAKLRFFISLLVDEKVNSNIEDNFGIEPLPNLETKLVAANSLIGLHKPQQLFFKDDKIIQTEKELSQLRKQHFTANNEKKKKEIEKRDRELRNQLKALLEESGFSSNYTEKIASWDPYDTNRSADWFDPEWMFGIKKEKRKIQKEWKTFNITWTTHNSRKKENYMPSKTEGLVPIQLSLEERNEVAQLLAWRIKAKHYRVLAMNVLDDHVHLLLVAEEKDVPKIVGDLKSYASHEFDMTTTHDTTYGTTDDTTHDTLGCPARGLEYSDSTRQKLWSKHYNNTPVEDFQHFANAIDYINNNHLKHQIPAIDFSLFQDVLTSIDKAFKPIEEETGFDIVMGNPPYGIKFSENEKKYFKKQYLCTKTIPGKQKGSLDSFSLFIEKGFNILKRNGNLIYIVPISITSSDSMTALHNLLEKNCKLIKISSYAVRPQPIFQNAVINTSILFFIKTLTPVEQILCTKMYRKGKGFDLKTLLENLQFIDVKNYKLYGRYPKISLPIETRILDKLFSIKTKTKDLQKNNGKALYYRTTGGRYFKIITNYSTGSTKEKAILIDKYFCNAIGAIMSSNLFFWYYQIYSNNLDLKSYEIDSFPIPINELSEERIKVLEKLYDDYLKDIEKNAKTRITTKYAHIDTFKEYKIGKSKKYIDAIDDFIGPLYGLNEEEIEFIKNYEIEFRLTENKGDEN
ncbi:MAG: N-6 DNA methylase [Bacteroidales bacterium]|jgi:adenine-specific DNA-methyltransferase|nr:N-6 DNA methylase [Bacteroidales bacterium]